MGYTTKFNGKFTLSKLPSAETIVTLRSLEDYNDKASRGPGGYCQWELSRDCMSLAWDGNEKFYDYVEWMQWILDDVLTPEGITLSGEIKFQGEEIGDSGTLTIQNGKVVKTVASIVSEDLAELKRFKDFVLASDYASEIADPWKRANRK